MSRIPQVIESPIDRALARCSLGGQSLVGFGLPSWPFQVSKRGCSGGCAAPDSFPITVGMIAASAEY